MKHHFEMLVAANSLLFISSLFVWFPTTASAIACGFGADMGDGDCRGCIGTTTVSFTVPTDWNSASNTVELLGAGGKGGTGVNANECGGGGGGGAYVKNTNISLTIGNLITFQVGLGGGAGATGSTTFNGSAIVAAPGWNGGANTGGLGGAVASSTGTLIYAGGRGKSVSGTDCGGGGGGGAAGPHGAGANGGDSTSVAIRAAVVVVPTTALPAATLLPTRAVAPEVRADWQAPRLVLVQQAAVHLRRPARSVPAVAEAIKEFYRGPMEQRRHAMGF
jgi:hypothetical protein